MKNPLSAVLIGAGDRGYAAYAPYALTHQEEVRFVAVAEPDENRRMRFAREHNIPREHQYTSWEDLFERGQMGDMALVTTMDSMHAHPATVAMEAGYHVLLEKPMATTLTDCVQLVKTSERTGRFLQICHVLRFTEFFSTLNQILASGRIGDIVTVEHRENLVYWHMAHSYVRGHWRNSQIESPMILAKCCHDLDILHWNLGRCRKLSSFGSLLEFRPENAPDNAPQRCTDGCPAADECPYYAPRLYLELTPLFQVAQSSANIWERMGASLLLDHPRFSAVLRRLIPAFDRAVDYRGWPVSVISTDTSLESRQRALESGPWGRCVYHCDNNVVDHQIVNMQMESGASVVLVMQGHSHLDGRTMRYDGTRATLRGRFINGMNDSIEIHDHQTGEVEYISPGARSLGHGGGDEGIMKAFVQGVRGQTHSLTPAREALESHLMAFAAEYARLAGEVVDMADYRNQAEDLKDA